MFEKNLILEAIENNILCFDRESDSGFLTKRLIHIMKWTAHSNKMGKLVQLWVPKELHLYNDIFSFNENFPEHRMFDETTRITFVEKDFTKYYESQKASLASCDTYLIIGKCEKKDLFEDKISYLLGSC